jgi:hypothetical protein
MTPVHQAQQTEQTQAVQTSQPQDRPSAPGHANEIVSKDWAKRIHVRNLAMGRSPYEPLPLGPMVMVFVNQKRKRGRSHVDACEENRHAGLA